MPLQELEQVAARYGDMIYRVALSYTRSSFDAEDVLQEVLLEHLGVRVPFQSEEHEKRWLIRVAVNRCKNLLRAAKRRRSVPLEDAAALAAPPEPEHRALFEAVLALPPKWRITVDLFYYEGYATGEIAALLGVREGTVRTWLHRARQSLKATLKEAWNND